jgi:hypothetical protein
MVLASCAKEGGKKKGVWFFCGAEESKNSHHESKHKNTIERLYNKSLEPLLFPHLTSS